MNDRLALYPDVYWAEVRDGEHVGVYLLGNHGQVVFPGAQSAQWLQRLLPFLNGEHTVDELTARMSPPQRQIAVQIIESLAARKLLHRCPQDRSRPEPVDQPSHEASFLDSFVADPWAALARYRRMRVLVVGDEPIRSAVAQLLRSSGVGTATALPIEEAFSPTSGAAEVRERVTGADAVVLTVGLDAVDTVVGSGRLTQLAATCADAGTPLAQAMLASHEAWLIPIGSPVPAWPAVQLPLRKTGEPDDATRRYGLDAAGIAAVAGQLVQQVFRALTGSAGDANHPHLVRIDRRTLESSPHRVILHPASSPTKPDSPADLVARVAALAAEKGPTEEEFSQRAARLTDSHCGIVTVQEHGWPQTPLHVTQARGDVPGPVAASVSAVGVGFTLQSARVAAVLRAVARCAWYSLDPRRLVDADGVPMIAAQADPDAALARLRDGSLAGWVRGCEVEDSGRTRLVPATHAFEWLAQWPPDPVAGIGAGLTWQEAVLNAVLEHCQRFTLTEVERGAVTGRRVGLPGEELDEAGARSLRVLTRVGEVPPTYDVTGSLGVPTFAFATGRDGTVYLSGATRTEALSRGLVAVLQAVQARVYEEPRIRPDTGLDIPPHVTDCRSVTAAEQSQAPPGSPGGRLRPAALARRLRRQYGVVPVIVPLDHGPGLLEATPYLVRVVVCDG